MVRTSSTRRPRPGGPARRSAPPSPRRGTWLAASGLVTAFVLGLATAFVITSADGPDATERRIAELRQEEAERDLAQLGPLTDLAKETRDRLTPVLAAMAEAAPIGGAQPASPPSADVVKGWKDVVAAAVKPHETSPSAGNGINMTRTGMRVAVQQLATAVDGFEASLTATEPLKSRLVSLAGDQRTLALRTWSVAAVQLDLINVEAGRGHVHVQLPSGPDSGVIAPDPVPEGGGRG
ncbi:hypothetical protein [Saccharothrix luteola]|uniref:hypothetical protein n=1 Tax=Saccharothrix luteola TaxID=2893018 RepID=UPI001E359745|nr:hypothetical protein [Saccharothrix luteola]MCC8250811.1 hypothetical protein [Saccharothrix luteola]